MQGPKVRGYSLGHYEVSLTPLGEKELDLSIFDQTSRNEFQKKGLTLANIVAPTLMMAFENNRLEIKLDISVSEETLKVHVLVASTFSLPVEETIQLPKQRTVPEHECLARTAEGLGRRFEALRRKDECGVYCNEVKSHEQEFNGIGQ